MIPENTRTFWEVKELNNHPIIGLPHYINIYI